jgi:transposase
VVVREGKYMALSRSERTLAVKLMREKGYSSKEVSEILRMESAAVTKAWQRAWPVPREDVPDTVMGGAISSSAPLLSRSEVRRVIGR